VRTRGTSRYSPHPHAGKPDDTGQEGGADYAQGEDLGTRQYVFFYTQAGATCAASIYNPASTDSTGTEEPGQREIDRRSLGQFDGQYPGKTSRSRQA